MKETTMAAASQGKPLGSCSPVENISDQYVLKKTALWENLLLKQADHPVASHRTRSKRPLWHLVNVVLCLLLVGSSLAVPFVMSQTAWAVPQTHLNQASPDRGQLPKLGGSNEPWCDTLKPPNVKNCMYNGSDHSMNGCTSGCYNTATQETDGKKPQPDNSNPNPGTACGDAYNEVNGICALVTPILAVAKTIVMLIQVIGTLVTHDFNGWLTCILTAGAVSCPITSGGTPWSFDCPVVTITSTFSSYTYNGPNGPVTTSLGSATYTVTIDQQNSEETIYQVAIRKLSPDMVNDWLSGDGTADAAKQQGSAPASEPGHLVYTYNADTFGNQGMPLLTSGSMLIALTMIGPLFALAGFQLLMASVRPSSEKMVADAVETLGRVLLVAAIVGLAYYVVQFLFDLTNRMNSAVVSLHQEIGYPQTGINGSDKAVTFSNPGDTSNSFRGLVMPMALWGCVLDDFIGLMADRVANSASGFIPVIGGILGIAGRVHEVLTLVNDIGEFVLLVLSVTIWGQAIARIILINYYIIMAPIALACWGLPGQLGGQVTRAWFKGLLQLLFMQTLQIFILTTVPTLLPDFGLMKFPHGTENGFVNTPLQTFLTQLPPLITTMAAVGAPKVMMGIGPMNTVAKAGAIAGKAVTAGMMAINSMTKR